MALTDPVPSTAPDVANRNLQDIDRLVNSSAPVITRTGKEIQSLAQLDANYIFTAINGGVWANGQQFTAFNQYMVFSGTAYKPKNTTALPYTVGASPDTNFVEVTGNLSFGQGDARYTRPLDLASATADTSALVTMSVRITDRGDAIGDWVSGETPNGFDIIAHDTLAIQLKIRFENDLINMIHFGAVADGVFDNKPAIQAALDKAVNDDFAGLFFPTTGIASSYYVASGIVTPVVFPRTGFTLEGSARGYTRITTDQDIDLFTHDERLIVNNLIIQQTGPIGTGVAFRTRQGIQARYCRFDNVEINNFKYGNLWRFGLWNSWNDFVTNGCTCGIRLARYTDMEDQTNPAATANWNLSAGDMGWFHNQLSFTNVLLNGGEVGFWGSCMGAVFNNISAQNQQTDGTSNSVLPAGQVGTGMWFEGGGAGSTNSWYNVLNGYYHEDTLLALKISNTRKMIVNGMFSQGAGANDTLLEIDNSAVRITGQVGQGTWTNRIVATNNSIIVSDGELKADGSSDSLEAGTVYNANGIWTDNGDIGSTTRKFRELYLSGDAFFGTDTIDPAGTGDDGVAIDSIGRLLASRNGPVVDLNSRGANGKVAVLRRSNSERGSIGVTNSRGGAMELEMTGASVLWTAGTGSPEGVLTAGVGSMYTRTDGGAGTTLYIKESGAGNTGWVAK